MVGPMRQNLAPSPARPLARLAALLLAALLLQPVPLRPAFAQDDDLPEGVEAYASTQAACFAPGELAGLDAGIDAARQPLRGCASGVIPPEPKIVAAHAYKPGGGDKFDCASLRRRQESSRFLYAFLGDVVAAAERGDNACAAGMLRTWAEAGAMTSAAANSPGPSRALGMFVFGGLSSAYLIHPEVRAAAGPAGEKAILAWFQRLSGRVAQDIAARRAMPRLDNILYWQGFSILPTALMTADPELMRLSRGVFRTALDQVTTGEPDPADDGYLPLELRRGDKALGYQVFATFPVAGMATLSRAYGCDFVDGAPRRAIFGDLVTRSVQGGLDPQSVAEAAVRLGAARTEIPQQKPATVRQTPGLMYLVNRMDPKLYGRIDADLAATLGLPQPVVSPGAGAGLVNERLGGSFGRLADQAAALAAEPTPAPLRKVCGR